MTDTTTQLTFRLPTKLIARIERHARRMRAAAGGRIEVSRTDAARDLLGRALDIVEAEERAAAAEGGGS